MARKRSRWFVRLGWGLMVVFSSMVALYALGYVVLGEQIYVEVLVESFLARPWGIYTHAFFAMFALALGPFQFRGLMIEHKRPIHRTLGKIYVVGALMTGLSGLYMAVYAYGGWITQGGWRDGRGASGHHHDGLPEDSRQAHWGTPRLDDSQLFGPFCSGHLTALVAGVDGTL